MVGGTSFELVTLPCEGKDHPYEYLKSQPD